MFITSCCLFYDISMQVDAKFMKSKNSEAGKPHKQLPKHNQLYKISCSQGNFKSELNYTWSSHEFSILVRTRQMSMSRKTSQTFFNWFKKKEIQSVTSNIVEPR